MSAAAAAGGGGGGSAATTASAFEYLSSVDFHPLGVLAGQRDRLEAFDDLYTCKWTCQVIFQRALSSVAQNYCARLLCVTAGEGPERGFVSAKIMQSWAMQDEPSRRRHDEALRQLQRLCILLPGEILEAADGEDGVPDHKIPTRLADSEGGWVRD
jgi:hypothetical protein